MPYPDQVAHQLPAERPAVAHRGEFLGLRGVGTELIATGCGEMLRGALAEGDPEAPGVMRQPLGHPVGSERGEVHRPGSVGDGVVRLPVAFLFLVRSTFLEDE